MELFIAEKPSVGKAIAAAIGATESKNGYMEGRGNDDLQPQGTATRAEIAALAVRVQPEALPRA